MFAEVPTSEFTISLELVKFNLEIKLLEMAKCNEF